MDRKSHLIAQFRRTSKATAVHPASEPSVHVAPSVGSSAARSSIDFILITSVTAGFAFLVTLVGLFLAADLIMVMERVRIVERGTHQELLSLRGSKPSVRDTVQAGTGGIAATSPISKPPTMRDHRWF